MMGAAEYRNGSTSHQGRRGHGLPGKLQLQTLGVVLLVLVLDIPSSQTQGSSSYCSITCHADIHTLCKFPKGPGSACQIYKRNYLTQAEKNSLLHKHNELRNHMALGLVSPYPAASNMMQMKWDDELEKIAQRWADQCTFKHDKCRNTRRFKVGQNIAVYYTNGPDFASPESRVQSWYDEINLYRYSPGPFTFSSETGHFTQIVWSSSTHLGCARAQYIRDKFTHQLLVCNYGPGGNIMGRPLYSPGSPCSRCKCSNTYRGLCAVGSSVNFETRNEFPSYSPDLFSTIFNETYYNGESTPDISVYRYYTNPTTTRPTLVQDKATVPQQDISTLPQNSLSECPQPSAPGAACGSNKLAPVPLKQSEKEGLLRVHNKWRAELARGGLNGFPRAADMEEMELEDLSAALPEQPPISTSSQANPFVDSGLTQPGDGTQETNEHSLTSEVQGGQHDSTPMSSNEAEEWDEELADLAQRWANQCIWGHDPCRKTSRHTFKGQNIALSYGTTEPVEQRALEWFDEARLYNFTDTPYQYVLNTSHFSQMAWAETYLLGCARAEFPYAGSDANLLVCNYGPGGNVIGRKIFTPGQPCSKCRRGSCSSIYPSLCTSQSAYQTTQRSATFYAPITTSVSPRSQQPAATYATRTIPPRKLQQPTATYATTTSSPRRLQQPTATYATTTSPPRRFQQPTVTYATTSTSSPRKLQQPTTSYATTTTLTSRRPQQPVTFFATTTTATARRFQLPASTSATTTTTLTSRVPQQPASFYATTTTRRLQQPQQANELDAGLPTPPFVRSSVCPRPEGPGPACGDKYRPSALSPSDREALLAAHNDLRNRVASGLIKKMPTAANMNQLEWNDNLAKLAQRWSDQCTLGYDSCARTEFYQAGQNMAVWYSHDIENFPPPQERVSGWFKEIDNFYYNNGLFSFNVATSALTQMLWAPTRSIGCGRARFFANNSEVASELIVCNYGPGGNIVDQKIYQSGNPCSQCEAGSQCSLNYPALCSFG